MQLCTVRQCYCAGRYETTQSKDIPKSFTHTRLHIGLNLSIDICIIEGPGVF